MVQANHYGLIAAKRSLGHFFLGRGASALSSVLVLMLLVRVVPKSEYGALVAWLAVVEIFYLFSGFGLSSVAQRYVPEFRAQASSSALRALVHRAFWMRLAIAAVLCPLLGYWSADLAVAFGAELPSGSGVVPFGWLIGLVLFSGVMVRFADEMLAALLFQGLAQALALLRSAGKLPWLIFALWRSEPVSASEMLLLEAVLAVCAALLAWSQVLSLGGRSAEAGPRTLDRTAPDKPYRVAGMWRVSLHFYAIQVLGQIYGPNALKLLVSRTLGLEATAAFGFALSVVDMLRNYLPAHLLAGWIRPLLVARYVDSRDVDQLGRLTALVLKVNLLGILIFALVFGIVGNEFGALLSGGRFSELGILLCILMLLVGLQTAHLLLTMMTLTLERPAANLIATALACLGLPLAVFLSQSLMLPGIALGLVAAELIWISVVWRSLVRAHSGLQLSWSGMATTLAAGLFAGALAALLMWGLQWQAWWVALVSVAAFCVFLLVRAPFSSEEKAIMLKFVPARLVAGLGWVR